MIRAIGVLSLMLASASSISALAEPAAVPSITKLISADLDQKALQTPAGRKALAEAVKDIATRSAASIRATRQARTNGWRAK